MSNIIICTIFLFLLTFISKIENINRKIISYIACIIVGYLYIYVFSYFRTFEIPDTLPYFDMYNDPKLYLGRYESGYLYMNFFIKEFGLSFNDFISIYNGITLFLILLVIKSIFSFKNIVVPLLVFTSFIGSHFFGITLRISMAMAIIMLALLLFCNIKTNFKRYLIYYLLLFLAAQFHQTVLLFAIFPLFVNRQYSDAFLYMVLAISLLLPFFSSLSNYLGNLMEAFLDFFHVNRLGGYVERADSIFKYSLSNLQYILFSLAFVAFRKKMSISEKESRIYNLFLNIYVLGAFIWSAVSFIPAGGRLAYNLIYFEFILAAFFFYYTKQVLVKYRLLFIGLIVAINLFSLFSKVPMLLIY